MITSTSNCRERLLVVVGLSVLAAGALAYEWTYQHKPLKGVYATYGGGLGDPWQPTQTDHKIMFSIEGPAAKAMFDGMGPDAKEICSPVDGDRIRKRDGEKLYCMRSKRGEYQCNFGFDLRTGKSVGGIIC
ncbi:MAG: hypothetical protein ACXW3Z_16210 [Limisphaerales bacterium]